MIRPYLINKTLAQASAGMSDHDLGVLVGAILGLLFVILLWLLLRGVFLWYWKIYEIVDNQNKTNKLLAAILKKLESQNDTNIPEKDQEQK